MSKPKLKPKHLGIIQAVIERQPDKAILITVKDTNVTTSVHGIDKLDDLLSIVGVSLFAYYESCVPPEQRAVFTYANFFAVLHNAFMLEARRVTHENSSVNRTV